MPRVKEDTGWLSEGVEEHEVSRSSKSSSSTMSKITSKLRRISNTNRRSSRPGSTDGGGAPAAMSKTGGNPFAGADLLLAMHQTGTVPQLVRFLDFLIG